jgi:phage portal protein BeeE
MFSIDCADYESAIRRDLLTPAERKKYYAKFSLEGLLTGRNEGPSGILSDAHQLRSAVSPNEARGYEDLNPYDGGDEFRTRTSTTRGTEGSESEPNKRMNHETRI